MSTCACDACEWICAEFVHVSGFVHVNGVEFVRVVDVCM